jgi:hypothetical protein
MEQTLNPVDIGRKDKQGNQIYNLNLKTKVNAATGEVIQGLTVGNYVIVEKVFATGFEAKFGYSCKVRYNNTECSFFLSQKEHEVYKDLGGIGDKVKITAVSYEYKYQGVDKKGITFQFELLNN